MKKLIILVVTFAIISFSVTAILINRKNNIMIQEGQSNDVSGNLNQGDTNQNNNVENDVNESPKEKTIDLNGLYDENDLKIEEVTEGNVTFPRINGLKNKEIEEKVNNDMKTRVMKKVKEISDKNANESMLSTSFTVNSNFANVISISQFVYYAKENIIYKSENISLNYELVNGERLMFEDLFVKGTDLHSIVRRCFYRTINETLLANEEFHGLHYDSESNEWKATYWDWEKGEDVNSEYIPKLTEYEINKMIKKFFNNNSGEFYFTPTKVYIPVDVVDYYMYSVIVFEDIADKVTIYDKYLTKESLYETSGIGKKNLWTCSIPNGRNNYIEYGFAEDNLFYEISTTEFISYNMVKSSFVENFKTLRNDKILLANNKIDEFRNIARQNKDKFYMFRISNSFEHESYDKVTNIVQCNVFEECYHADIKDKEQIMNKLVECYRYYNLGFYTSAMELFESRTDLTEENIMVERNNETKIYDLRNLKEITSVEQIFKNGVDYISILNEILKTKIRQRNEYSYISEEELNRFVENSKYSIDSISSITANILEHENTYYIHFSDLDDSILAIYDVDLYILSDSATRKLEKFELQNLSLDELNKAYNEIFARHGHEFKSTDLKEYFNNLYWYNPIPNKTVTLEELNEIEKYNLDIIKSAISEKKNT